MNFNLLLKEKNYKEIPENSTKPEDLEEVLGTIRLPDTFCAYERPERFFLGEDGDVILHSTTSWSG